jgi:hypothetical protein
MGVMGAKEMECDAERRLKGNSTAWAACEP